MSIYSQHCNFLQQPVIWSLDSVYCYSSVCIPPIGASSTKSPTPEGSSSSQSVRERYASSTPAPREWEEAESWSVMHSRATTPIASRASSPDVSMGEDDNTVRFPLPSTSPELQPTALSLTGSEGDWVAVAESLKTIGSFMMTNGPSTLSGADRPDYASLFTRIVNSVTTSPWAKEATGFPSGPHPSSSQTAPPKQTGPPADPEEPPKAPAPAPSRAKLQPRKQKAKLVQYQRPPPPGPPPIPLSSHPKHSFASKLRTPVLGSSTCRSLTNRYFEHAVAQMAPQTWTRAASGLGPDPGPGPSQGPSRPSTPAKSKGLDYVTAGPMCRQVLVVFNDCAPMNVILAMLVDEINQMMALDRFDIQITSAEPAYRRWALHTNHVPMTDELMLLRGAIYNVVQGTSDANKEMTPWRTPTTIADIERALERAPLFSGIPFAGHAHLETIEEIVEAILGATVEETVGVILEATVGETVEEIVEAILGATLGETVGATLRETVRATVGETVEEIVEEIVRVILEATIGETVEEIVEEIVKAILGAILGATLRETVGATVGEIVEEIVEAILGATLGETVGATVEEIVEATVEETVEEIVEAILGATLGETVGATVEEIVEATVEETVGEIV
ncbi:hypothetical protein CPB84DRAFT_1858881 [Gymnopilus junonius]|uniref:Uncharacterized protein n=1 Tax=Gymnopilus junonius TaxID=109634 RepID=A0A9P5TEA2_GYMJU|nr:hypothetical protein CPB84DRAFT_1858881 [Gymnopilus junonius]